MALQKVQYLGCTSSLVIQGRAKEVAFTEIGGGLLKPGADSAKSGSLIFLPCHSYPNFLSGVD